MAEVSVKVEVIGEEDEDEDEQAPDEDWCFFCKDGGDLILCDYENCPKAFHLRCVRKNGSSPNSEEEHWECAWHSCFYCKNPSNLRCYVCPKSVCSSCMNPDCFFHIKGKYGFCYECSEFALVIESIDIDDRSTRQKHFKEYYDLLNKRKGVDLINLLSAKKLPIFKNNDPDRSVVSKKNGDFVEDKRCVKPQKRKINYVDVSDEDDVAIQTGSETRFAAIIAENIRLIYLTKNLVLELLKQPESFESKVRGSFVRVKSGHLANGDCKSNSYQLVQVLGVTKDDPNGTVKLQLLNVPSDISIDFLSDAQFSENECEILRQNVESGLLNKPTVEELEQKAKALHHDLTKNLIERELKSLVHLIDLANEKGRRHKYVEYLERKERLETESEVKKMMNTPPKVIATEVSKIKPVAINTIDDYDKKRKKTRSVTKSRHVPFDLDDAYKIKSQLASVFVKGTLANDTGCVVEDDVIQEPINQSIDITTSDKINPKNSISFNSCLDDEELCQTLSGLIKFKPTEVSKKSLLSVPSKAIYHIQKGCVLSLKEIPISNYKELMIPLTNGFFATLQSLNINYTQLYSVVKDYIRSSARLSHIENSKKSPSVEELTIKSEKVSVLSSMSEMLKEMEKSKEEMVQALDERDDCRKKWLEEEKAKEDFMNAKAALDCEFMI